MSICSIMMVKNSFMKKFLITDTKYNLKLSTFMTSHQILTSFSIKLIGNNLSINVKIHKMIFSTILKLRKTIKTQGKISNKGN